MAVTELLGVFVVAESARYTEVSQLKICLICVLQLASVHKLEWGGLGSACT